MPHTFDPNTPLSADILLDQVGGAWCAKALVMVVSGTAKEPIIQYRVFSLDLSRTDDGADSDCVLYDSLDEAVEKYNALEP